MLRPTSSPIIFIQQLGRGLRKYEDKEFLTVLDFIGNHNRTFLIAMALKGGRYYDKDSLKVSVATDFRDIPGCSNIEMDRIAKERILDQLNTENFNHLKYLREEYNEFKTLLGGRIPYSLMEYIKYDGASDPLKFINYSSDDSKTYQGFIKKVEKSYEGLELDDEEFLEILKELSKNLPLKRPHEFAIIRYLINKKEISIDRGSKVLNKYLQSTEEKTIIHTFRNLNQNFYDSRQLENNTKLFEFVGEKLIKLLSFEKILLNKKYRKLILDILNYGLIRYEKEFGSKNYGVPFLKLYEQYQMVDTALLSNYEKTHSSFRGSGLVTNGKEYFTFIDLHKEEGIKESINYKDEIIDRDVFQWQTPNNTAQTSERGKNIIKNKERGINLHIFIRKYRTIDNKVEPYIYIGKGDVEEFEGERPITVKMKLQNKIPENSYVELIKKV